MSGLWKLAAMSVVMGAGLVVVWQAQQGLKSSTPTAGVLNRSETETLGAVEPDVNLGFADPAALGLPTTTEQPPAQEVVTVAASVPPEQPSETTLTAENPKPTEAARYRRGLNFRENAPVVTDSDLPGIPPQRLPNESATKSASVSEEPFDYGPTLLNAAPDAANDFPIVPVAAEEPAPEVDQFAPEADPFSNAAPPAEEPAATEKEPAAPRLPSFNINEPEPSPAPTPNLGAPALDPLPVEEAPSPLPRNSRSGQLLQEEQPAADDPFGKTEPFAAEPPPSRLPTDLDADPGKKSPPDQPEAAPGPAGESFDPFAPAKVPTPPATAVPVETLPSLDATPALTEPEAEPRTAAPARRGRTPASNIMIGDGTVPPETPRGVQEPRLTIEKTAPAKAVLGQQLVYSILVRNVGTSPATQVTIEDRIPRGTRLVGTAPRAEMLDKKLVWKLGTLQPNDERKIAIKVIPEEEGTLGSVAKVTFVTEVAADIVVTSPRLQLRVNGPSELRMQETAEFVFTLSNPGEGDAKNVILRSIIPEGLSHPAGSDLEYKIERLAPGESRDVRLELTGAKVGRVTHQSIATADGNITTEAKTNVEVVGEQLVLTRSSPPRVYIGRQAVFTNKVGNEGQRPVQRVRITETVPMGLDFVEASDGGIFDSATRTVTWNVGPLAIGGEHRVSATLNPRSVGKFEGVISATGPTGSVATVKPQVSIEGFPSLALEPLGEQRLVAVGERITSKVQIKNNGSAVADHVKLAVNLPPELKLVSVKAPAAYQVTGQRLQFEPVDSLPPRTGATFELVLEAVATGDVRLELQIAADHLRLPVRHEEAVQVISDK